MLTGCSVDILSRYHNSKGIEYFEKNYLKDAKNAFEKSAQNESISSEIAKNNVGVTDYEKRDFDMAIEIFEALQKKQCEGDIKSTICDQIYYNLGNSYFRMGERIEEKEERAGQIEQWQKSIESYKKGLTINSNDERMTENLSFVQQKLQEAEQKQSSEEGDTKKQDGEKSESGKEEEKGGESEGGKEKEDHESGASKTGDDEVAENQKYALPEKLEQQVEQYMKQMEQQQKQKHFQQNPDAQENNSDDPFSDPFFQQFFGNPFQGKLGDGKRKKVEKDW